MAMIEKGVLKPERLIGNLISLADAPAALAGMDQFGGLGINVVNRF
jgi:alcohol dehydrogenase